MAESDELPAGTVTFLFTDIEGSTQLLKALGRERYRSLLATHNRLVRAAIDEHGGVAVGQQGDAFFAAFRTATAALAAAAEAQRLLLGEPWPPSADVRVRMGVHTGEVIVGRDGYVGFAVHQAARIADAAQGGQILLSRTTARLVEHDLPDGLQLHEVGSVLLPDLDRPEPLAALEVEGFPATRVDRVSGRSAREQRESPLFERDGELAALRVFLETSGEGDGQLVVIEGSAGIGKSRLLAEAREMALGQGMRVLAARGGEHEAEFAFSIVRQLFEPLLAGTAPDRRSEWLSGAAALAGPLFQPGLAAAEESADSPFAIQHGLYWLAANIAFEQPTLLAVDDLHWADGPSLRWLDYLVRRLEGLPLLVLTATRPPEQGHDPALLAALLSDPATAVVQPGPLTIASIAELARERFRLDPDEPFAAAVAVATGGNPLFVTALLDTVARDRVQPTADHARRVLELGPRTISRAVSLRLARLPGEAVEVAHAAAILGDGAELRHTAALSGLDPVATGQAATRLVRVDLLRRQGPIEFFHPVVRAAVYDTIDAGSRLALHRRAAEILAAAGAPPEQAAGHLLHAAPTGDPVVLDTLRAAAGHAMANGAHDAAAAYLTRALAEPPTGDDRFRIQLELGLAERRIGAPEAVEHLYAAIHDATDPIERARAALDCGRTLFHANRRSEALEVLGDAVVALGDADPDLHERLVAEIIATARWSRDYYPLAAEHLADIDEARLHGGVGSAQLLAALAIDEAARCASRERALDLAHRALAMPALHEEGAVGFFHAVNALIQAGETEAAYREHQRAVDQARRHGNLFSLTNSLGFLGHVALRHGDLLGAEADLREGLELTQPTRIGSAVFQWYGGGTLAEVLVERGQLDEAAALIEAAALDRQPAENLQLSFLRAARGKLRLARREPDQALADFQLLGAVAVASAGLNPNWVPWRSLAALALHQLDRGAEARELVEAELELTRSWGAPVGIAVSLRTLGLVEPDAASGLRHLADAADLLADTPARLEHARTLVEHGAALRRANTRTEARSRLRQGLDLAHRLGAQALVEQAGSELAATGARPRTFLQTGLETLTASERRVAQMAAQDMTNKDIAQALFVTVKTVEVHLSNVYRKLGLKSRRQLGDALAEPSPAPAGGW